jgi:hypothetical protein
MTTSMAIGYIMIALVIIIAIGSMAWAWHENKRNGDPRD